MEKLWNVRGVGAEARERAKKAAKAAGQTMGRWIERAIEVLDAEEEAGRALKKKSGGKPAQQTGMDVRESIPKISKDTRAFYADPERLFAQAVGEELAAGEEVVTITCDGLVLLHEQNAVGIPQGTIERLDRRHTGRKKRGKRVKVCAHGTMAGNHCWQCGGKAAVK